MMISKCGMAPLALAIFLFYSMAAGAVAKTLSPQREKWDNLNFREALLNEIVLKIDYWQRLSQHPEQAQWRELIRRYWEVDPSYGGSEERRATLTLLQMATEQNLGSNSESNYREQWEIDEREISELLRQRVEQLWLGRHRYTLMQREVQEEKLRMELEMDTPSFAAGHQGQAASEMLETYLDQHPGIELEGLGKFLQGRPDSQDSMIFVANLRTNT